MRACDVGLVHLFLFIFDVACSCKQGGVAAAGSFTVRVSVVLYLFNAFARRVACVQERPAQYQLCESGRPGHFPNKYEF